MNTHMLKEHPVEFRKLVLTHKLKGWESLSVGATPTTPQKPAQEPGTKPPFSIVEFRNRLVRFVVAGDHVSRFPSSRMTCAYLHYFQSISIVDNQEFRDLITYASDYVNDIDIPHRTQMTTLIQERFQIDYSEAIKHMKVSV